MTQVFSTPSKASPAGDDRLSALLDVVGRLAEQQKLLLDAIKPTPAAFAPPVSSLPVGQMSAPPSPRATGVADDVRTIVSELFREHQTSAARDAYARDHLADLPEAYRRLLPTTSDSQHLASAEQTIRQQFRADLKAVRRSAGDSAGPSLGGDEPGGHPPAAAVDYSKLSPLQQIAVGLRSAGAGRLVEGKKPEATPSPINLSKPSQDPIEYDPIELFVGAD